jgi:hypothetical protein
MRVPAIPITDPRFNYVQSAKTDIRDTFRRAKEQMEKEKEPNLIPEGFVLSAEWFEILG